MQQNKDGEQNLLKLFGLFSLLFFLVDATLFAKSFEDFKHTQSSSFTHYKDVQDKEFNTYLHSSWQEYTAKKTQNFYEKPKPKSTQKIAPRKIGNVGPLINILLPKIESKKENFSLDQKNQNLHLLYFGQKISLNVDLNIKSAQFYPQNQNGIVSFFNVLVHSKYENSLHDIKKITSKLALNSWAEYLLVKQISEVLYRRKDEQRLYTWFILNKLGYDVKVGLSEKHVVLLHWSKKIIYATSRYSFAEKKYYLLSSYTMGKQPRVYTYKQKYPGAHKALELSLKTLPNFQEDIHSKTVSFHQFGVEYPISYTYDKNLIDFLATYPQADYETYFNAPFSPRTYNEIAEGMKKYLDGKKASEAINFVLNFVQKAFIYESDQEQFGHEKVMFAYETLYYNKSDCEDRATLFAFLVKKLFHISAVGVKYKDHMAIGLNIPMLGDSVYSGTKRYLIADPTYIDANIGESMPKYKSIVPQKFIYLK